jgi:hypothetical protein
MSHHGWIGARQPRLSLHADCNSQCRRINGLSLSMSFGPIPFTESSCSKLEKLPRDVRNSTIRWATAGLMPGSASSSAAVARFRFSGSAAVLFGGRLSMTTPVPAVRQAGAGLGGLRGEAGARAGARDGLETRSLTCWFSANRCSIETAEAPVTITGFGRFTARAKADNPSRIATKASAFRSSPVMP